MKPSRFGSTIAAALMAAGTALAQQPAAPASYNVGYVSMERVLSEAREALETQKSLEAEFYKRGREIAAGPPAETERRKNALVDEMNQRRDDALKQMVERATAAIKRIAEQENLDAVFLDATYAAPRIDLTDKLIKALDATR